MNKEIWKEIKGYEKHRVSSLGNIDNLSVWFSRDGYPKVSFYVKKKSPKKIFVHRLVAEQFIPNPENKPFINHINGIKTDNRVENLEWCTRSENDLHAYKIGLKNATGEKNGFAKLSQRQVLEIRAFDGAYSRKELSGLYGISLQHLSGIINRKFWKHI